ncbi:MAG: AAA family ATPase, partial [Thermoanaerobaculia bacterium]|nr:AAA family ATPase [Thermoanaerobaculia bacterium]
MADAAVATEKETETLRLQVAGTKAEDAGRGVARMSRNSLRSLGAVEGDVVEIVGKRRTAAVALGPYPEDEGVEVIRLDGLQRANADVGIGDQVEVRRAEPETADRIQIAPAQKNVRLTGSGEALKRTLLRRPLTAGDVISTSSYRRAAQAGPGDGTPEEIFRRLMEQPSYALQEIRLVVVSTKPSGIVRVGEETTIELLPEYTEPQVRRTDVTYDDVGGIGDTIDQVREMIELPLKHPELFQRLGITPPKGVLLHGPPGTGKTLRARAVANESDAQFFTVAGPEIVGRHYGESEERLRTLFDQASEQAPAIIFIDELDS